MRLQIDKGSAAGIAVGAKEHEGQVLQGSSGEDPLDGGDFTVVQIIGPNEVALASSTSSRSAKNTRVVVTLEQIMANRAQ